MADPTVEKETLVAFNKNWTDRVNGELKARCQRRRLPSARFLFLHGPDTRPIGDFMLHSVHNIV